MTRILDRHEENLMGLPYPIVLLDSVEEITDPASDEVLGVAVPDAGELAASVALALCFLPVRLMGAEVRFIRRVMGMTGQDFAAAVEMDPATLSRWENGKQDVGGWADKAIRMAAVLRLQDHAPGSSLRPEDIVSLRLHPRPDGMLPEIEVRRVQASEDAGETAMKGWDALARMACRRGAHRQAAR